jgi:anti-anti-sigma factor
LTIHDEGGGVLRVVGEFDVATASEVQARLAAHRGPAILDLREVTFIDSTGLRTLLGATRERGGDEPLVLRTPSPAVRRLIELAALTEQLAIEPDAPDEPH